MKTLTFIKLSLEKKQSRQSTSGTHPVHIPKTEVKILVRRRQKSDMQVCQAKKDDIKFMLKLTPIADRQYYNSIEITEFTVLVSQ